MAFHHQSPPRTFVNPPIPFTGAIHGGLLEGTTVTINGRVLPGADKFHVNFQCGTQANADIAFHFNPRFDSFLCYVVANTSRNSKWESEERQQNLCLSACSTFSLTFTVHSHAYQVSANGNFFMEYKHRIPFLRVDAISVGGKVEVSSIAFQNPMVVPPQPFPGFPAYAHPFPTSHIPPQAGYPAAMVPPQPFPGFVAYPYPTSQIPPQAGYLPAMFAVPHTSAINGGLYPGRTITIQGAVNPSATRFSVNLNFQSGVALHYNARFNENTVVRNSKYGTAWGSEERSGGMPFQRGQPFTLTVCCEAHSYRIVVNGNQAHTYKHRHTILQQINMLEIVGDITLTSVSAVPHTSAINGGLYPGRTITIQGAVNPSATRISSLVNKNTLKTLTGALVQGLFDYACTSWTVPQFAVPHTSAINGGLYPGRTITIQGAVNPSATRFSVNLNFQSGVALHYNARFNENTVVRNSKYGNAWGSEERSGGMPFQKGQPFTLTVCCEAHSYRIVVNGNQAHTYKHRHTILQQINMLEIVGDITLTSVSV